MPAAYIILFSWFFSRMPFKNWVSFGNIDDAAAYYNRGIVKKNLGDYQGAIADFNQAIQLKPDYANAYNNRGVAKSNLGDKQGAIADFNQAAQFYSEQGNMEMYSKALRNQKGFWGRLFSWKMALPTSWCRLYSKIQNLSW